MKSDEENSNYNHYYSQVFTPIKMMTILIR